MKNVLAVPCCVSRALLLVSSLLIALIALPPDAYAGQYTLVSQTGGTWTRSPNYGGFPPPSGGFGPTSDGYYGGGEGMGGTPSSATASGTITTVFQWVKDPGDSGDIAPENVIVTEYCSVKAGGSAYGTPLQEGTHTADNGFGSPSVPEVTDYSGYRTYYSTSAGNRYAVQKGGDTVTVTCTVSASASSPNGTSSTTVRYSAGVQPVIIGLAGTTLDNGTKKILTGQQVKAVLDTGNYTVIPGSYNWSVSGGAPFRSFTVNTAGGQKYDLDAGDKSSAIFNFFTAKDDTVTVTCSAQVQLPDRIASVTAEARPITSVKPTMNWEVQSHYTRFNIDPEFGPTQAAYFAPFYLGVSGNIDGQRWVVTTTVPAPFSGGQGCFSQLITPGRYATLQGSNTEISILPAYEDGDNDPSNDVPGSGTEAHDGVFPNAQWSLPDFGIYGDAPQQPTTSNNMAASRAADSFRTWVMYNPPSVAGLPTSWVPIQKYAWQWGGTAQHIQQGNLWTGYWSLGSHYGALPTIQPTVTDEFPSWQHNVNDVL